MTFQPRLSSTTRVVFIRLRQQVYDVRIPLDARCSAGIYREERKVPSWVSEVFFCYFRYTFVSKDSIEISNQIKGDARRSATSISEMKIRSRSDQ